MKKLTDFSFNAQELIKTIVKQNPNIDRKTWEELGISGQTVSAIKSWISINRNSKFNTILSN